MGRTMRTPRSPPSGVAIFYGNSGQGDYSSDEEYYGSTPATQNTTPVPVHPTPPPTALTASSDAGSRVSDTSSSSYSLNALSSVGNTGSPSASSYLLESSTTLNSFHTLPDSHAEKPGSPSLPSHLSKRMASSLDQAAKTTASSGLKEDRYSLALGATTTVIALLRDVCGMFDGVPYVTAVAGIALEIIQIADDIRTNKERARELIGKVTSYSRVVFGALSTSTIRSEASLRDLKGDLMEIGSVLESIHEILLTFTGSTASERLSRIINRSDILSRIEEQDRRLDTSITAFQLKSSIVLRINAHITPHTQTNPPVTCKVPRRYFNKLRSKPQIMFGRDKEVEFIVNTILEKSPARVAILGPGGIGKTSTALSVLHDDRICARYGDARLFVSCEAAASVDLVLSEIALSLQINTEGLEDQLYNKIIHHLGQSPSVLVLDNFETPWDMPDVRSDIEMLLEDITSLEGVAVIVTLRGSQHPAGVRWSQPLLPSLQPVDWDSAVAIFQTISGKMDTYAAQLIRAVDCVPLAVSLLGNLAAVDGETPEALWLRWQEEYTAMVERGDGDRLSNLEYSIRLSLSSPRMTRDPDALPFLSLFSLLPDGISPETYLALEKIFPNVQNLKKPASTLRQNALLYMDPGSTSLRILNPIRLFVQSHHPPSPRARTLLQDYYINLALQSQSHRNVESQRRLRMEIGNIEAMLMDTLQSGTRLEKAVDATLTFAHYTYTLGLGSTTAVALAVERISRRSKKSSVLRPDISPTVPNEKRSQPSKLGRLGKFQFWRKPRIDPEPNALRGVDPTLKMQADCLGCWGQILSRQSQFKQAEAKLCQALELHTRAGDISGQAYDLHNLGCLLSREPCDLDEAELKFQAAMKLHDQTGDRIGQAYDFMGSGHVLLQRSKFEQAMERFQQALKIHIGENDIVGQATALNSLGHALIAHSRFEEAEGKFTEALSLSTKAGDVVGQADTWSGLACTFLLRTRFEEARVKIEAAIALRPPPGDAEDLHILGRILCGATKFEQAEANLLRALELHTLAGDHLGKADDWQFLAHIYFLQGNIPNSLEKLHLALETYAKKGKTIGEADVLSSIGLIDFRHSELNKAEETIRRALKLHTSLDCALGQACDLYNLGCIQLRRGQLDEAHESLTNAMRLHSQVGNIQGEADDQNKLCEIFLHRQGYAEAITGASRALALHIQIGDISGQADDLHLQANIFKAQNRLAEAEMAVNQALQLHMESGVKYGQARDYVTMSAILLGKSKVNDPSHVPSEAVAALDKAIQLFKLVEAVEEEAESRQQYLELSRLIQFPPRTS